MAGAFDALKNINRDNWKHVLVQFIKFGIVGLSNTLISTAVYYVFIAIDKDLYFVGNVVGWIVSVLNSFYWNNRFVFKDSEFVWYKKLLRTYVAYAAGFAVGSACLALQVKVLGVSEWLAPWINLCVTIPVNFILNNFWAFKS